MSTLIQGLPMTRLIGLSVAMVGLVAACGGRAAVTYDWEKSPEALIAARGTAGGNVPQMTRFLENDYGSSFVRLMGDGTLYYGEPQQVKTRQLGDDEISALFTAMRPDLFPGYDELYQATMATDGPTTDVTVDVKTWGSHTVGIYALGAEDENGYVPQSLLDAAEALEAVAQGGTDLEPTALRLGALALVQQQIEEVDPAEVEDWPLAEVPLDQASIYGDDAILISDPEQVATVLELVEPMELYPHGPASGNVFRYAGAHYWVAWAVVLP
jgi:hypothetical protein